jgi:hypothetical protein
MTVFHLRIRRGDCSKHIRWHSDGIVNRSR